MALNMIVVRRNWFFGEQCISSDSVTGKSEVANAHSAMASAHASNGWLVMKVCPLSAQGFKAPIDRYSNGQKAAVRVPAKVLSNDRTILRIPAIQLNLSASLIKGEVRRS
jgi:hypothetical protein